VQIADFEKVLRLRNGTGPPHWRHGQRAQRAGDTAEGRALATFMNQYRKLRDQVLFY